MKGLRWWAFGVFFGAVVTTLAAIWSGSGHWAQTAWFMWALQPTTPIVWGAHAVWHAWHREEEKNQLHHGRAVDQFKELPNMKQLPSSERRW
jgi:hypothetical protein